jgi:hypothetical protein
VAAIGEFLQNSLARVSCCSIEYDFHFDSPFPLQLASRRPESNACDNTYMSVATRIRIQEKIVKESAFTTNDAV